MKKVAVILAGCGVFDGTEIHEAVLTLLRIEQQGATYYCMAPNKAQMHVVDHLTGGVVESESRNTLTEAARIARGEILDLAHANPNDYDALIIPGGFGAAKNLSDFATKGADCTVDADVIRFTQAIAQQGKPIGMICIAPAMAPQLLGTGTLCTVGSDPSTAAAIEAMGGTHQTCSVDDIIIDETHKLVTTPAYMLATSITEAAHGINKLVDQVLIMSEPR